jgi:hypothetical protein
MAAVRRLTVLTVSLAAVLIPLGCAGGDNGEEGEGYPEDVVSNFMASCESSAVESSQLTAEEARTMCRCVIDEVQETLPLEAFREFDARVREQGEEADPPRELSEALETCDAS